MREFVLFFYYNYEYYFVLLSSVVGAFIVCSKNMKKEKKISTVGFVAEVLLNIVFIFTASIYIKHHGIDAIDVGGSPYLVGFLFKCLVAFGFGLLSPSISYFLRKIGFKFASSAFFKDNIYGIAIFIYFLVDMIERLPATVVEWVSCWYATDYSMGIGSRFFIGSLLKLFYQDYLPEEVAYHFCVLVCFAVAAITSFLLNFLINNTSERKKVALLFMILVFLVSPGSITSMWLNLGRLETNGLLIGLICLVLFEIVQNIYLKYALITALSCLSMAIYQGNLFMYYPIVLVPIIYDVFDSEKRVSRFKLELGCVNIVLTSVVFIFFQFFSYTKFASAEEMVLALSLKTDLPIIKEAIEWELFSSISYVFEVLNVVFLHGEELPRESAFITFVVILPIVALLMALFREVDNYYNSNRYKHAYFYYLILLLSILPQYILNVDWGRWMIATNILVFVQIFYLVYKKDAGAESAIDKLSIFLVNHKFISGLSLVYIAGLGKFVGRSFISEVNTIIDWLVNNKILIY